jgi:hypothetical protein
MLLNGLLYEVSIPPGASDYFLASPVTLLASYGLPGTRNDFGFLLDACNHPCHH